MVLIRQPAVAGTFYPANPEVLQKLLNTYLNAVKSTTKIPKAIIVPHAGYIYSGEVAASAYARLKADADKIKRVVLVGPSHHVYFEGLAVSHANFFNTPLGGIPVDTIAIQNLLTLPFVGYDDEAHALEHSLEVQLPFLQTVLKDFKLIPIVVGNSTAAQVSQALELFYDEVDTLIVISSDLSHYHDYATAQQLDLETSHKIENLQYQQLDSNCACGCVGVSGLLALAEKKSRQIKTVDLRNSGDTAGDKSRVVGYGAYVID
ncbi:MAG: AmmeMemoRadiSam system protein B [Methylococcales bacterium]|nr:AmmeMemoRadiSam system protein B [Methylococcales bacterium]MDD5754449.1 AmmeMemoRadiSam system protein B [Methylococcales bacterium]